MNDQDKQKAEVYLAELEQKLKNLPVSERSEILLELNTHIEEAMQKPDKTIEDVLKNLGTTNEVAERYGAPMANEENKKSNRGCLKWGCLILIILALLFFLITGLLFKGLWHMVEEMRVNINHTGSSETAFVDIDEENDRVSVLGGFIDIDGKNERVKIGNLVDINGQSGKVNIAGKDVGELSGFKKLQGNGQIIAQPRDVGAFEEVAVKGGFDVNIVIADTRKVEIVGDENLLPHIKVAMRDDTLDLSIAPGVKLKPTTPVVINIQTPELSRYYLTGSGKTKISNLNSEKFKFDGSGSGTVELFGKVERLILDLKGSGKVDSRQLIAERVAVKSKGASDVKVFASEAIDVNSFGSGNVTYYGSPKTVEQKVFGTGSVHKADEN
ncbi:MAG: DUF2807 domain-containing protein [Deltaproteobacteria bacterium]|nr:DUF2807 domain-containing protein [Deltaproteobacteria bacterium]